MKLVKALCCRFLFAFFGLDGAQNTQVVYSVLRNYPIAMCWFRNSCIVHERKTKDCARPRTFQPKSWHLCLLLRCLPGLILTMVTHSTTGVVLIFLYDLNIKRVLIHLPKLNIYR